MFVQAPEVLLRSVSFGPGPQTVLALNGWSAAWEAWEPTFEVLSESMRCLSFDTRGTGNSPAPASSLSLERLVDDVFRVLDAHAVDRCVLAGESLGGFIALHCALKDPSRFTGLALVASAHLVTEQDTALLVGGARANYVATVSKFVQFCFEKGFEHLHPWGEQLFLQTPPEVAARLFEVCHDQPADLSRLSLPTIVVHGTEDRVVPAAKGRHIAERVGARFVELVGAGHAPTVTRPREVAEAIRSLG